MILKLLHLYKTFDFEKIIFLEFKQFFLSHKDRFLNHVSHNKFVVFDKTVEELYSSMIDGGGGGASSPKISKSKVNSLSKGFWSGSHALLE